MIVIAETCRAH